MGSVLYDYLSDSVLFDEKNINNAFARLNETELRDELARYRRFCLEHLAELRNEVPSHRPNSVMFSGHEQRSFEQLMRTGLYVEGHVLDDPLFALTHEPSEMHRTMVRSLGVDNAGVVDRADLCEALRFLRSVTPMIEADYVKFLPISRIYEPPKSVELHYSDTRFSELVPPDLLAFFNERAHVRSRVRPRTRQRSWKVPVVVHDAPQERP